MSPFGQLIEITDICEFRPKTGNILSAAFKLTT
jgi:hypothetical protein